MTAKIYSLPPRRVAAPRRVIPLPDLGEEITSYVDELNHLIDHAPEGLRPAIIRGHMIRLSDRAIAAMLPDDRAALILLTRA